MDEARRQEWHRYYSEKRIGHQWYQAHLLEGLPVRRVLEIGPYLGLVAAMLDNAGYEVTTLDLTPPQFAHPKLPHIQVDLARARPEQLAGFDLILCCETLEHLPWKQAREVVEFLYRSGARYLITSVPYEAFQIHFLLDASRYGLRQRFAMKRGRFLKRFPPGAPLEHQWEVGYRGHGAGRWEAALQAAGWQIRQRAVTAPTRSIFHLLERGGS